MKTKMLASLLAAMAIPAWGQVKMEAVSEKIPTYQIGNPEVDPIFSPVVSTKVPKGIFTLTLCMTC